MKKMKKSAKILIIVAVTLLIAGITVFAATMGKSNSSYVRIRQKATTESEVLDVLMEGDQVEIIGEEGDWYKVQAKGHTGYVSKAFITKNGETTNTNTENNQNTATENNNTQTSQETQQVAQPTTQTATITTRVYKVAENTQVYILPIISTETIGTVNAGESIDLINSTGLWGFVKTNSIKGWVRIDKLSSEEVTTTVEVPAEQTPEQVKPEETKPEETKPEETKPEETKPEETKPEEVKPAETPVQEQPQTNYAEKTMYVCVAAVNVRQQANTTSEVVSGAALNTAFTVVGEENGWYKVKVNGNNFGYIRKDLLSDKKTEETSRSNEVQRAEAAQKQAAQAETVAQPATTTSAQTQSTATQNTTTQSQPAATTTAQAAPAQTAPAAPAKSSNGVTGADVVAYAQQFLGCRYVYGAAGPSSFDCSGLTMYVYKHFGYNLSHSSKVQATQGVKVTGELQPGDILVFSNDGKQVGHVGLYIGNDKFIHASDSTTGVIISNLHDSWNIKKYWGARRIIQ